MEPKDPSAPSRLTFRRAFRPFFFALAVSGALLAWDFHEKHVRTTVLTADVRMEGRPVGSDFSLSVDGRKLAFVGLPVGIGWKKVIISAPDADPEERECFVWYGGKDLGAIDLRRSRGKVEFKVIPPAPKYTLRGELGDFTSPTGFFAGIPAGEYTAGFVYGDDLALSKSVRVIGNQTLTVRLTNAVGGIEIVSDRDGAEFTLEAISGRNRWGGRIPFSKPFLPSGAYRLLARLGEYRIDRTLNILPGLTNRTVLEFVYGGISVTSDPAGATVAVDQVEKGTTPVVVDKVIPGEHRVSIQKSGFDPVVLEVTVQGTNVAGLNHTLVNTRYRVSMEEVTESRRLGRFRTALRALEVALEAQPNDPVATPLLAPTKAAAFREECADWLEREDLAKAERALSLAVAIEPDATDVPGLRMRIDQLKQRVEQERVAGEQRKAQENAERALQNARNLIRSQQFDEVPASVEEARKWVSNHPQIPVVEQEFRDAQAAAEKRRIENQIAQRRRELDAAINDLARADDHRPTATRAWTTTKSAREVQTACEPKDGKGMKMFDVVTPRAYLITWRNGNLIPLFGGTYVRFAAADLAPNLTEIRAYLYRVMPSSQFGAPASQVGEDADARAVRSMESSLRTALGGDLRNP